jgi:2-dehydropantoate 2-reductase
VTLHVVGAGAVGLSLTARLARSGAPVRLVVRRAEVAHAIERQGVQVWDPAQDARFVAQVETALGIAAADIGRDLVLLCVRSTETEAAAEELARAAPEATIASVQNDVDNEEKLARRFRRVLGVAYRQTCTRTDPATVTALGAGRLALGRWPEGDDPAVGELAELLRAAGYDVGVSARIVEDKWLKLCVNLTSSVNALVRRDEHESFAFAETKARLLEEARDVLAAEGLVARSCDGRDRGLEEEIAWHRGSLAAGRSARRLPVYNQVWQSLASGRPLEADRYHRRILAAAERHAIPAPVNARVLAALRAAAACGEGPERSSAAELLP